MVILKCQTPHLWSGSTPWSGFETIAGTAQAKAQVMAQRARLQSTEAQVLLVGAQGLLPERAEPYAVRLRWQREDGQWRLLGLEWS